MGFTETIRTLVRGVYALSPYAWCDFWMKKKEAQFAEGSDNFIRWRERRKATSERYILYWFFASVLLFILSPSLPTWFAVPLLLRALGVMNKELGVVVFGTCKITEGNMVAASDRTIVLALVNYLTVMLIFATVYSLVGVFEAVPDFTVGDLALWPLIQSANIQFTLSQAFTPLDQLGWFICIFQSGFCFLFGTIVISMFVSLLNVRPQS